MPLVIQAMVREEAMTVAVIVAVTHLGEFGLCNSRHPSDGTVEAMTLWWSSQLLIWSLTCATHVIPATAGVEAMTVAVVVAVAHLGIDLCHSRHHSDGRCGSNDRCGNRCSHSFEGVVLGPLTSSQRWHVWKQWPKSPKTFSTIDFKMAPT